MPPAGLHGPDETFFNNLIALVQDFDLARSRGIFNPLPEEEPKESHDAARIRTVRSRLTGLGYLPHDSALPLLDPLLMHAIKKFQQDAGLTPDGWVGRQTWHALQELVSFERQGDIARWFTGNRPGPALERAIALRLHVLGLTDTPAFNETASLALGLQHFQSVAAFLQLPGQQAVRPEVSPATIALLFDQDLLVERLAAWQSPLPSDLDHPLFAFAACMARVELWMAGYDVTPAGFQEKEFFRPTPQILLLRNDCRLFAALAAYWRDHGKKDESPLLAQRFASEFPAFFRMIAAAIRTGKILAVTEKSALLYHMMAKQPDLLEAIWRTTLSLGGQIWDGIGRTWGWLHNLQQQPKGKTLEIGRNISRLVYHQAMTAYDITRQALQAFPLLLAGVFQPQWQGSDPRHIMLQQDRDLDLKMYINTGGDQEKINQFIDTVTRTSASFAVTCRIIAVCMSTLSSLIRQGRTGWAGLILTLLQVSGRIADLGSQPPAAPDFSD